MHGVCRLTTGTGWTRFRILKCAIYALLTINLYFFFIHASLHDVLDGLGWLILLGVFEFETGDPSDDYATRWQGWLVFLAHCVAYSFILFALVSYFLDRDWLSSANSTLWLLVVLSLAYDVYAPGLYGSREWQIRNVIKFLLYLGLSGIALWWGIEGETLDFYDAGLWIVCFMVVELNVFSVDQPKPLAVRSAADDDQR
jgi:hypothetical protein